MPEPTPQWLSELLAEILQEAAFVSAEPASGPPGWGVPVLSATLGFRSTHSGSLRLTTDLPAAIELAANMIGVRHGDPAAAVLGGAALGEMLNVVGGALVTRLFGRE